MGVEEAWLPSFKKWSKSEIRVILRFLLAKRQPFNKNPMIFTPFIDTMP